MLRWGVQHIRKANPTRKTCSKISVGLSIWPRMTIISLSMNSLNSRRLQVMFISSSVRICASQRNTQKRSKAWKLKPPECLIWNSSTSLQVTFSRSFCIMISLRRVLICRSVSSLSVGLWKNQENKTSIPILIEAPAAEELNWDTHTSEKSRGESARCDCTSCMAFHSLMRTWSEETLLW